MADAFIAYARQEGAFVRRLSDTLRARGRESWVDWEGIEPSDEWRRSIREAIEAADAFVFVISPDSVRSAPCRDELEHASTNNKRLIPVVHRDVGGLDVPPILERLNWFFVRDEDDFDAGVAAVNRALDPALHLG